MELLTISPQEERPKPVTPLLAHGFRPFFLLASLYGALFLPAWLAIFFGAAPSPAALPLAAWHGHEMVFGFAAAAVCGFLLTATATWSQLPPVTGGRLGALVGVWAAGRAAMWLSGALPAALVAVVDLALVPALAWAILPVLRLPRNRPNLILIPALILFFTGDLLVHLEALGWTEGTAGPGLRLGVNLLALLITIIIGRIVPTFLGVARLARGGKGPPAARPWAEGLAIGTAAAFLAADLLLPETAWTGAAALAAGAAAVLRMALWRAGALLRKPYLWALHLGYGWVAAAFFLSAAAALGGPVPAVSALHAMTAGGIGATILAVMSIVGLLHTGRPAEMRPAIVAACLLVTAAAALRVAAPLVFEEGYRDALIASGALWAIALGAYAAVYGPILSRPRPDGLPG